jgi:hypothetical protein
MKKITNSGFNDQKILNGSVDNFKLHIRRMLNLNSKSVNIALQNSNIDLVSYMIDELETDYDISDIITYGTDDLIAKYLDIDSINLINLVSNNETEIIKHVCQKYPTCVNKQNRLGQTMLMESAKSNLDCFDYLIKHGANPQLTDNDGFNVLYYLLMNKKDTDDDIYKYYTQIKPQISDPVEQIIAFLSNINILTFDQNIANLYVKIFHDVFGNYDCSKIYKSNFYLVSVNNLYFCIKTEYGAIKYKYVYKMNPFFAVFNNCALIESRKTHIFINYLLNFDFPMYYIDNINSSLLHLLFKSNINTYYLEDIVKKLETKSFEFDSLDIYNNTALFYVQSVFQFDLVFKHIDKSIVNKDNKTYDQYIFDIVNSDKEKYNLNKYAYDKLFEAISKINIVI